MDFSPFFCGMISWILRLLGVWAFWLVPFWALGFLAVGFLAFRLSAFWLCGFWLFGFTFCGLCGFGFRILSITRSTPASPAFGFLDFWLLTSRVSEMGAAAGPPPPPTPPLL